MSDDHTYFEDDESECPTVISEETITNGATANVTAAPPTTRTLAKKPNYSSQIWDFFRIWGRLKCRHLHSAPEGHQ